MAGGTAADVQAGRTAEGVRLGTAASVVMLWAWATRVTEETMMMRGKSMVAIGLRWLVCERLWFFL